MTDPVKRTHSFVKPPKPAEAPKPMTGKETYAAKVNARYSPKMITPARPARHG